MGLYDRDYTRDSSHSGFQGAPRMRMGFQKITPAVKWLLIINFAIFFTGIIIKPLGIFLYKWFQLDPTSLPRALQFWRVITYQFLHDPADIFHVVFNMLGVFFLGPTLERHWGSKRFLKFYLSCGAAGALFYLLLVAVNFLPPGPMVGASGAVLGMLAACAILFPQFVVFILFFPVPIRVAAVGGTVIYVFYVITKSANAGGHAAHLAGMAAGAIYVFSQSWRHQFKSKTKTTQRNKQAATQQDLQLQLDRILQKVSERGIHSLTTKEKKILKQATKIQQMKNKF